MGTITGLGKAADVLYSGRDSWAIKSVRVHGGSADKGRPGALWATTWEREWVDVRLWSPRCWRCVGEPCAHTPGPRQGAPMAPTRLRGRVVAVRRPSTPHTEAWPLGERRGGWRYLAWHEAGVILVDCYRLIQIELREGKVVVMMSGAGTG